MRTNLPVTAAEYFLKDGKPIVSTTDPKGTITYVNSCFIQLGGFTGEKFLGSPCNMVRHSGMPPEMFADFWRCWATDGFFRRAALMARAATTCGLPACR